MAKRNKKSKAVLKVDFTGVESAGNVEEGRQIAVVNGVPEIRETQEGNEYINWKLKCPGGTVYHTTSLQPQALWNLRNTLEAMGLEVPESSLELDLAEYDGMELGVEIEKETYQGKKRPRVIDVFPPSELDEEEDDEDEEAPKSRKKGKKEPEPEPEEEDEELTYDEVMEMDKDELLELAEDNDIKVSPKVKKKLDALREFIAEKLDLEPEEEEEPEPEPEKKSRRKGGKKGGDLKKGSKVTFEDDGEEVEGKVKSVDEKEGFAVVLVDGEEWEVELEDLTLA